ncbi:hypothetical protein [Roseovarius sp.]
MGLSRLFAFGAQPDIYYPPTGEEIQAAWDQVRTARKALQRLDYWFDTDAEILDAMSRDELAGHDRLRGLIRDALGKLEAV